MRLLGRAQKLTIIIGEDEHVYQRPLYEAIIFAAKKYKLTGATAYKGLMGYGADSLHHNAKVFALSEHTPLVVEMVDLPERIEDFSKIVMRLMDKAQSGGIMYITDAEVIKYSREPDHTGHLH
jgi:uncharacterized protein